MEKVLNILSNLFRTLVKVLVGFALALAALWLFYFTLDFAFKNIMPYISRAVLANFILFAGIITFIFVKLNILEKMENAKTAVKETIDESENVRAESEIKLSGIEESMNHLGEEIDAIIAESDERAKLVGEKILEDADKTALVVRDNTQKAIENNKNLLKNDLLKRASLASVEIAKAHILEELSRNSELHDKLIDESIEKIEGVEL